jgi:hypothetical protein
MTTVRVTLRTSKTKFYFDDSRITRYLDKKTASALAHGGGYVRTVAMRSMRKRKSASKPGSPPSRHRPLGQGLTKIEFAFDSRRKTVVVGPVRFYSRADGTTAPQVNEFGLKVKAVRRRSKTAQPHRFSIGERGPIRELGQPSPRSKRFARPILKTQAQVNRAQTIHDEYVEFRATQANQTIQYAKRPFMAPALEKSASKLAGLWSSVVSY